MTHQRNAKLLAAVLARLGVLLSTNNPKCILSFLVNEKALDYRDYDIIDDYSVLEDLVIQDIIIRFEDLKLNALWHAYNFGYFVEDKEKYLKTTLGETYEKFVDTITDNNIIFVSRARNKAAGVGKRRR